MIVGTVVITGGSGFIGGRLIERLCMDGYAVCGLARSEQAAERIRARGGQPVAGSLDDLAAMRAGAESCELAFHAAASLGDWGKREDFERGNVQGTRNALEASMEAGMRRFVHVGTEAALLAGEPLVEVDEGAPLRPDSPVLYSSTKAIAEQLVIAANREGFETVVVRPRFVYRQGPRATGLSACADHRQWARRAGQRDDPAGRIAHPESCSSINGEGRDPSIRSGYSTSQPRR